MEFAVKQVENKCLNTIKEQRSELLTIFQEERSQLIDMHNDEIESVKKTLQDKFQLDFMSMKEELEKEAEKKYIELDMKWKIDDQALKVVLEESKREHQKLIR